MEIVDRDGKALPPGEAGEIVVTHLATRDFPFIRYRTGDVAVLDERRCPCGRGLPLLKDIQGRDDRFRRRAGRHRDARPGADLRTPRHAGDRSRSRSSRRASTRPGFCSSRGPAMASPPAGGSKTASRRDSARGSKSCSRRCRASRPSDPASSGTWSVRSCRIDGGADATRIRPSMTVIYGLRVAQDATCDRSISACRVSDKP